MLHEKLKKLRGGILLIGHLNVVSIDAAELFYSSLTGDTSQTPPAGESRCLWLAKRRHWTAIETLISQIRSTRNYTELAAKDAASGLNLMMLCCRENRRAVFEALIDFGLDVNERAKDGMTALHYAASSTADIILQQLLQYGADPLIVGGREKQLAIHIACQRPSSALIMARFLLQKMPPHGRLIVDGHGNLPVTYAVETGNDILVHELLRTVATQQAVDWRQRKTKNTLLHLATIRRDFKTAETLIEHGHADLNAQNAAGQTALHVAASKCDEKMIKLFSQYRANSNIVDKNGETALHCAVRAGSTMIVVMLADRMHGDVQFRKNDGCTLMHLAAEYGHGDCVLALCKRDVPLHMPNKAGILSLHLAAQHGYPDVVQVLLQKGAPINARTKERYTPMHLAVLHNQPQVIQLLMGCGADVGVQGGPKGEMPLHIAARINAVECAKMLILTGAKINAPTGQELETPLHIAARRGYDRLAEILLDECGDVHLVSRSGESALHIAVRYCHYQIVHMLLSHVKKTYSKKDAVKLVNLQTVEGESALHFACGLKKRTLHYPLEDVDIVNLLLSNGADPLAATKYTLEMPLHYCARVGNLDVALELEKFMDHNFPPLTNKQARNGWSPLLTACYYGHHGMVELLTRNNARVDLFDEQGLSALHLSAGNGFIECCKLLLKKKAFVNIKTKGGITPIHLAAGNGFRDLVFMLVDKYGAALDVTTLDKKTPLHLAAEGGHQDVARTLIDLKANVNAKDALGQTPLHLAAECDHPDVVEMFLKFNPELVFTANQDGMTCAHIAAAKGSVAVIKELMRFNRNIVISARNKTTDSLPLHLAAEGGHGQVVRILIEAGSSPLSENIDGMTCIHLAAKEGHLKVLTAIPPSLSWGIPSVKTGLTPLHVAVFYSQVETVREMVSRVKPDILTEKATSYNIRDEKLKSLVMIDYGLTPLHVASYAGVDQAVRLLLNFQGVDVEAASTKAKTTPLHLAAQTGSLNVSSLLLSQSSKLLKLQDSRGFKPIHLAARNGHIDMVASLISQGSDINASDNYGWVPLHHATRCGRLGVVKLLLELGANVTHATRDDRVPLSLSAASGHVDVFMYLLNKEHDTDKLLEDKKFILDLMLCGRTNQQKAVEEFVLVSDSPLETAAQLSFLFSKQAVFDIEHLKDFETAAIYCEKLTGSLLEIASSMTSPSRILRAWDKNGTPFIDVLVNDKLKSVVADSSVQRYLTDVWEGDLGLSNSQLLLLFIAFVVCPPVLFYCSMPFGQSYHKVPIIKFMAYAASHIQFIGVLCMVVVKPLYPISTRDSFFPTWNEYVLLLWLAGNLTAELTNPSNGSGGRFIRSLSLALSSLAAFLQLIAMTVYDIESYEAQILMYSRNFVFSFPVIISVLSILEILTFSKSFGPLTIILMYMIQESSVPMTIMMVFFLGWWLQDQTIFTAICPDLEPELTLNCTCNIRVPEGCQVPFTKDNNDGIVPGCWTNEQLLNDPIPPSYILGVVHGALFQHEDFLWYPAVRNSPEWMTAFITTHKAMFHIVMVLVLLTLVVSIAADTLDMLMAKSDMEWQFGRAQLIRNMSKTASMPSPFNIFVKPIIYLKALINRKGLLCTSYAPYYIMLEEGIGDEAEATSRKGLIIEISFLGKVFHFLKKHFYRHRIDSLIEQAATAHKNVYVGGKPTKLDRQQKKAREKAAREAAKRKKSEWFAQEVLQDVLNWNQVVDRLREIEAEESEDEYVEQLGCHMSELEFWQADMWEEVDEIEDDEERIVIREWLAEEFKDIVKTT